MIQKNQMSIFRRHQAVVMQKRLIKSEWTNEVTSIQRTFVYIYSNIWNIHKFRIYFYIDLQNNYKIASILKIGLWTIEIFL